MHRFGRAAALTLGIAVAVALLGACGPPKSRLKVDPNPPALNIDKNFVTGLNNPWDMSFLPDGTMFFTERAGSVSVRLPDGTINDLGPPPGSTPGGEGGVMGIAVDPDFASNRYLYVCYTHSADNRVTRFTVDPSFSVIGSPVDIVTGMQKGGIHNGCRIRFGPDLMLWITMGEADNPAWARDLGSLNGKILRVNPADGSPAPDNPFPGSIIFTSGHRNPQGIAFRTNGEVYSVEHGTDRDDEVNNLIPGADYGWDGVDMTCCGATPAVWSSGFPTIAPSGATFVYGAQWRGYNGALVVAVLKEMRLQIYVDRGGSLDFANPVVLPQGLRLRSAVQGPDGNLYVATDSGNGGGGIWRIIPS